MITTTKNLSIYNIQKIIQDSCTTNKIHTSQIPTKLLEKLIDNIEELNVTLRKYKVKHNIQEMHNFQHSPLVHLFGNYNTFRKVAKLFSRKCFGKDVSKLFFSLAMMKPNFTFLLCFSDKMILDRNMFRYFMIDRVLGNSNG